MAKKKVSKKSRKNYKAPGGPKKQSSGPAGQRKGAAGRLAITLKDEKGEPITARAKILIKEGEAAGSKEYRAEGKADEVSRFAFDLAAGDYFAEVRAEGYKLYRKWLSVAGGRDSLYEFMLSLKEKGLDVEEKGKGDEGHLLDGRFNWFALQRLSTEQRVPVERLASSKKRDSLREREYLSEIFPSDGRQKALEQKKRMSSHDFVHASGGIKVEEIDNPLPRTSFGNIDRFVQVRSASRGQSFKPALLKIPFTEKDLGWVDAASLRVFEIDVKKREYQLVKKSGVEAGQQYAYAYIERPGVYGLIGLPWHPAVLDTVRLFCSRHSDLAEAGRAGNFELLRRICQVILCAADFESSEVVKRYGLPQLPGRGGGGNVCEFCLGLEPPIGGLPECELLDGPPGPIDLAGCNWLSVGPRNINGRIRAMAIHPTTGNTVYAGSANGGVWVTRDAGQSWQPLMHDEGALEIGALCAHLTDPALPAGAVTIYAGTGEPTSWPGYGGIGVLKSTDSGATWSSTGAIGNDRYSAVLVDPTTVTSNPATTTVYAGGTPGGLYKSIDGGGTWSLMFAKNITGLAMDPTNTAVLYAAVAFEGIYKYDPIGNIWNLFNTGLPGSFPLLILVVMGQTAPNTLYAKLDEQVFKYNTGTSTWTSLGNHGSTTYGYWNNVLAVDPQDSNILIAGGIILERTFDGGTTWQTIGGLHGDQHAAVFDSSNHLNVYAGNDGGVYRGTYASASAVGTWVKASDGLILTQFNHVGVAMTGIDVFGGGTQDNGTNRTVGGLTWDPILGADGGFFVVDPGNPYNLYAEFQSGSLFKSTNGGASFSGAGSGFPGGPWVTPIVLDPTSPAEPNRVLFAGGNSQVFRTVNSAGSWTPSSPNVGGNVIAIALSPTSSAIVYAGTSGGKVWRSSDNGATLGNWKNISVGTIAGTAVLPPRTVTDIVVHPTNPDIVFVTFSGFQTTTPATPGHVFRGTSTDGWVTWIWDDISSTLPDIPVNAIQVHLSLPNTLYVGTDVGVFRTTNGGLSWSDFGAGLPNVVIADLAINAASDTLRAATYGYGMFEIDLLSTCPAVDLYIRDNKLDTGETIPSPSGVIDPTTVGRNVYWWESADIKVDSFPYFVTDALFDGVEFDLTTSEDPIRNDSSHPNPNRLYVQVHNRGPMPTSNVKVKALWADASAGLPALPADFWTSYPNDWTAASPWSTVDATVPFQTIPVLLPHTPKVLLWNWNVPPAAADHTCMFVVVSSDEDPVIHSDGIPNDHLLWMLVPNDKHITLRNLHVITVPAPPGGSPTPFTATLDFHNPYPFPQFFDIVFDRSLLPRGTSLSLLLPNVVTRTPLARKPEKGIEIVSLTNREWWWRDAKRLAKRGWSHHCRVEAGLDDLTCNPGVAHIPGLLIPAGAKLRTAVIISPPPKAKPGSSFRFAVQQRQEGLIIGGSTFEIRIAPVEVKGGT
jgi:hypothetical protein